MEKFIKTKNSHKIIHKLWGREILVENNKYYCGKHLYVKPGKLCSVHYHKNKKETFYILKGKLVLEYSTNIDIDSWNSNKYSKIILSEGDSFTINPLTAHRFYCYGSCSCDFIEFSTHHEDSDSYRIIESK